jgi:pilus assembly protein Flp/PilA
MRFGFRSPLVLQRSLGLLRDSRAVTSLEYGILAGVLGLVLISMFHNLGSKLSTLFTNIGDSI